MCNGFIKVDAAWYTSGYCAKRAASKFLFSDWSIIPLACDVPWCTVLYRAANNRNLQ